MIENWPFSNSCKGFIVSLPLFDLSTRSNKKTRSIHKRKYQMDKNTNDVLLDIIIINLVQSQYNGTISHQFFFQITLQFLRICSMKLLRGLCKILSNTCGGDLLQS